MQPLFREELIRLLLFYKLIYLPLISSMSRIVTLAIALYGLSSFIVFIHNTPQIPWHRRIPKKSSIRILSASTSMSYSFAMHFSQTGFLYASVLESLASQLFSLEPQILHSSSSHFTFATGTALLSCFYHGLIMLILPCNTDTPV